MLDSADILMISLSIELGLHALIAHLKASAARQEQQEQAALQLAMLAYKHGIATDRDVALLIEAVLAEAQQGG